MRQYRILEEKYKNRSLYYPQYRDDDVMKSSTGTILGWEDMEFDGLIATHYYDIALTIIKKDYYRSQWF